MITGLGIDLCSVARMRELEGRERFLERFFTPGERTYILARGVGRDESMAACFAAKEALCKALGTGIAFPLTDIEVAHDDMGRPYYNLTGQALKLLAGRQALLSLTHEEDMAAAVCIIDG